MASERFVEWGHWGIDFRVREGDAWANPGESNGYLSFPVGNQGPVDLPRREEYRRMCAAWVSDGTLPAEARQPAVTA